MKTIQQDLISNNLSLNEAIGVAQNRPLWRLALYTLQKRRRRRTSLLAMQAPPVLTCFTVTRRINWYHRYRAINIWK